MAQDEEREDQPASELDPSHDLDLVTLFTSSNVDAEMEAGNIHAMLEASGVQSVVVGTASIPSLQFEVRVAKNDLAAAEKLVEEARAAGPDAAAEAEAAGESGQLQ